MSGSVSLDGPDLSDILNRADGYAEVLAVIEHELGHLVGLQHVADTTQLMDATNTGGVVDYAAGDLIGLSALGQGKCFPEI